MQEAYLIQKAWNPEMHPMIGIRKPVMVETVKRMSKVMSKVSKDIRSTGIRIFSAVTRPASALSQGNFLKDL